MSGLGETGRYTLGETGRYSDDGIRDAGDYFNLACMPSRGPTDTMTGSPGRTPPPPPRPARLSQAEAGSATATAPASEREEEQCKKAKENLDVGAAVALFGFAVLMGYVSLPKEHRGDVRLTVALLLSFATFLSGKALTLLSLNMLGRQALVSGGGCRAAAAKCLVAACTVLPVLTLLSLLALLPGGVYLYAGLDVATATVLAAAGTHWCYYYLSRSTERGGDVAAAGYDGDGEHIKEKEELDAASKVTSCVTNSAFGGLVGALFSASKISGAGAAVDDKAAHAAIFFLFATAILGTFVTTVLRSKITTTNQRCGGGRRILVAAVRLANTLLLCSLACAAFAAAFVVLGYRIFAAFTPLAMAGLSFLLQHCIERRHGGDGGGGDGLEENPEAARIKAMEDIASKVTVAALGGIVSVLGGALGGEKDHRGKQWGSMDALMLVLTSAFVSGFGFMVFAAAPGSAKLVLAPVARVLVWSTVLLFSATAVAVYAVEAWTILSHVVLLTISSFFWRLLANERSVFCALL